MSCLYFRLFQALLVQELYHNNVYNHFWVQRCTLGTSSLTFSPRRSSWIQWWSWSKGRMRTRRRLSQDGSPRLRWKVSWNGTSPSTQILVHMFWRIVLESVCSVQLSSFVFSVPHISILKFQVLHQGRHCLLQAARFGEEPRVALHVFHLQLLSKKWLACIVFLAIPRNDKYSSKVKKFFVEYSDKESNKKTNTEIEKSQTKTEAPLKAFCSMCLLAILHPEKTSTCSWPAVCRARAKRCSFPTSGCRSNLPRLQRERPKAPMRESFAYYDQAPPWFKLLLF